jgi:GAF domain-containing protein
MVRRGVPGYRSDMGTSPRARGRHEEGLAEVFAGIARRLRAESTPERTRDGVTRAAVDTVAGCDHAAIIIVRRRGGIETVAATDEVPVAVDTIQYESGQGPCLDALSAHETYLIQDLATDERWPRFSRAAAEATGVRSMLSFRLFVEEDTIGALNLYSRRIGAFDETARAVGSVLAAHAAIALDAAREKERADQLEEAVASNREIGMAVGILMAGGHITREEAFDRLRRASRYLNVKLRDVAARVVETGALPDRGTRPGP